MDKGSENRTAIRLPMSVPVKARFAGTTHNLMTLNVSVDGAFIVTAQPPERGQLVQLTLFLSTSPQPVLLQGMVVRTVSGAEARQQTTPAGMGVQYYGLGQAAQTAWEDFFHQVLEDYLNEGGEVYTPAPALIVKSDHHAEKEEGVGISHDLRATPNFYDEPNELSTKKKTFDTLLQTVTEEEISLDSAGIEEAVTGEEVTEESEIDLEDDQERDASNVVESETMEEVDIDEPTALEVTTAPLERRVHPPREVAAWEPRDQMLVEVSMKPASRMQAEDRSSQPALFRIRPVDVEGVRRFKLVGLEQGGIVIAGAGRRRAGALAVVAIVHPLSGGEFHIPGEIQSSDSDQQFIPVRFLGLTERTLIEFEHFANTGSRTPKAKGLASDEREMVLFYSADEAQKDFAPESKGAVLIGMMLPFYVASSSQRRR